ncbi:MAG TPA: class I SAM-dependent methyltransferase, partial [Clostridiales bacterium]|nr:class I SAM-dependent methyltransferase [Clostridiales bacterium]
MEHYFIEKEHKDSDFFEFTWQFLNYSYIFKSCDDVFSKDNVDYGTFVLLKAIAKNATIYGDVLDIGCGYGVIGIVLSKLYPDIKITQSDVNETALMLTRNNIKVNNVNNIKKVVKSNAYENIEENFDFIISNPPIKAGKKVL